MFDISEGASGKIDVLPDAGRSFLLDDEVEVAEEVFGEVTGGVVAEAGVDGEIHVPIPNEGGGEVGEGLATEGVGGKFAGAEGVEVFGASGEQGVHRPKAVGGFAQLGEGFCGVGASCSDGVVQWNYRVGHAACRDHRAWLPAGLRGA